MKPFSWVEIKATGEKGVVHKILGDGKLQVLVPRVDSPFPKWVDISRKEVKRCQPELVQEESPF